MTRDELARQIADRTGLRPAEVVRVLRALEVEIFERLSAGEDVSLGTIGRFHTRWQDGRTFRSIADFRKVLIDGHYVVKFRPGKKLREAVRDRTPQYWRDPRHQSAWRVADTLLGDLILYHRESAPHGLPEADEDAERALRARFGEPWGLARRAYEAKVPDDVRDQVDHLLRAARARWGEPADPARA